MNVEVLNPITAKNKIPQTRLDREVPRGKFLKGLCYHCADSPPTYKGFLCDRCSFYAINNFNDLEYQK